MPRVNRDWRASRPGTLSRTTVYRDNYVMALKGLTQNRNARSYVSMLTFAQRYTAQLDC
jgi:hypothetical protein